MCFGSEFSFILISHNRSSRQRSTLPNILNFAHTQVVHFLSVPGGKGVVWRSCTFFFYLQCFKIFELRNQVPGFKRFSLFTLVFCFRSIIFFPFPSFKQTMYICNFRWLFLIYLFNYISIQIFHSIFLFHERFSFFIFEFWIFQFYSVLS